MRNLLTESKSLEKLISAFQKRNPNIDTEGLKQLLLSDPTAVSNDRGTFIGKYATWIGNLFVKGLIKPGDSWELKKALSIYDQNKESLLPIEKYTSLAALIGDTLKLAQVAKKESPVPKEPLEKVYEDNEWVVYIPHTYRASRQIGQGTHWCTASSNPEHYKSYTQHGDLYVNIRKSDGAKFQIHFESKQAMDADDEPVALGEIGISEGLKNFYFQRVSVFSFLKIYYQAINYFSEGLAQVELNDKWGFIDETGREICPCKYDWANDFEEGLSKVRINDKWGCIDTTGREICPCKYSFITYFSEGLALVQLSGKYGFIDTSGKEVIPLKYDYALSFSEGLARVKLNGKWGFIDKTGEEVIPCKYENATSFSEGLAAVCLNGKWGYIDKTGNEVISLKYEWADLFLDGLARVRINGSWGYIDKYEKWYDKRPSVLPESINKITISDIRYMVNECVKQLIQ